MKLKIVLLVLISAIFCSGSCQKESVNPEKTGEFKSVQLTEKQKAVIAHSNAFGFEFYKTVNQFWDRKTNLMVSPLSVSMALGMTRNGAAGTTLEAMTNTLKMNGMKDAEMNESYKSILETFSTLDPKVKLSIANSIWYRNTFSVLPDFVSANKNYFKASVTPLDFSSPQAVNTINNWVSDNTNKLIPSIVDQINADMVMFLINAVYFKGQWRNSFDKAQTASKPFYLSDGSTVKAPAMLQSVTVNYFKGDGFGAVELPYNQGNYNMIVLLPDNGKTVADVTEKLSPANWNTWYQQFAEQKVDLQLPKYKFKYDEKQMIPVLKQMGMGIAFGDKADFTRVSAAGNLRISEVKHKTYIETNEEGTEAAAVTSVGIRVTSIGPSDPLSFVVNRPFVFFISEKATGTILFIGTVMNPLAE